MKKIGEGYSYKVYEIENNRVLKVFKRNYIEIFLYLLFRTVRPLKSFRNILLFKKIARKYYQDILEKIPLNILASPVFINDYDYTQDKVLVYNRGFKKLSSEESIYFIDKYFELFIELLHYGYFDNVFNFTRNCGVDNYGNIKLVDFNELSQDFEKLKNRIKNFRWQDKFSYKQLNTELKKYFDKKAEVVFSIQNLEKNWKINIKN